MAIANKLGSVLTMIAILCWLVVFGAFSGFVALVVGSCYWGLHLITGNRSEHHVSDRWPIGRDYVIDCTWTQHLYVAFMMTMGKFVGNFGG